VEEGLSKVAREVITLQLCHVGNRQCPETGLPHRNAVSAFRAQWVQNEGSDFVYQNNATDVDMKTQVVNVCPIRLTSDNAKGLEEDATEAVSDNPTMVVRMHTLELEDPVVD
jgi:hypothetical protein